MSPIDEDPLLQLYGDGKDLWADETADDYVSRLREGWDEAAERRENPDQSPRNPTDRSMK